MLSWETVAVVLAGQAVLAVTLIAFCYLFVRYILPRMGRAQKVPTNTGHQTTGTPSSANGQGYGAAWQDLRQTLEANKQRQIDRGELMALVMGLEQEHGVAA